MPYMMWGLYFYKSYIYIYVRYLIIYVLKFLSNILLKVCRMNVYLIFMWDSPTFNKKIFNKNFDIPTIILIEWIIIK